MRTKRFFRYGFFVCVAAALCAAGCGNPFLPKIFNHGEEPQRQYSLSVATVTGQSAYGTAVRTTGSATGNAAGSGVTVTATPASGYVFAKWVSTNNVSAAAVSTNAAYTFNINANTSLYAVFAVNGSSADAPKVISSAADLAELGTAGAANKYYKLADDFALSETITITASNVHINGNGKTVSRGTGNSDWLFFVGSSGASLTLSNIIMDGENAAANEPLVQVEYGTVTLGSGAVVKDNKTTNSNGVGGVKACLGGTLIMEAGASITGNEATYSDAGGGVMIVDGSDFIMNGGTISGNTGGSGGAGGVHVYNGTFTMNCAQSNISGNSAPQVKQGISGTINGTGGLTAGW
jgi:hypothetical protein